MKKQEKDEFSVSILNPLSDRYRVCPYCSTAHLVRHLGRDYCSSKCADSHYNEKRRLKKQAESMLNKEIFVGYEGGEVPSMKKLKFKQSKKGAIQNTVLLLNKLDLGDEGNYLYKIIDIESVGVNFNHYSMRVENDTVPGNNTSFYLLIGNYKVERITKEEVRITRTISFTN